MKIHRFIGSFDLSREYTDITDRGISHQIARVLRLKSGEAIVLCDGKGNEADAIIVTPDPDKTHVRITDRHISANESKVAVTLYCAILKRENFDLAVQKAVELGVSEIVPIRTARTIKLDIKRDRTEKIIREAAEQSGRGVLPVLHEPMKIAVAIADADRQDVSFAFEVSSDRLQTQLTKKKTWKHIGCFIGPEGGWDESELSAFDDAGVRVVGLGDLTFRAETAAIVASYLLCHTQN
jgi:16S rRNA (uracil1498-N3)-methyltransferase